MNGIKNLNNDSLWGITSIKCLPARDEDPDPVIFGPRDPVLFSTDPDPTYNNGFIKLFLS